MEISEIPIEKKSWKEFDKDVAEFVKAKNKLIENHGNIICGFKTFYTKIEAGRRITLDIIWDDPLQNELYE